MSRRTSSRDHLQSTPGRPLRPAGRAAIPASAAGTSCGRPEAASLPAPERSGRWSRRGTATPSPKPICSSIAAGRPRSRRTPPAIPSAAPVMILAVELTPEGDRAVVVAGQVVALADPAEQEDVVVHRRPEDGEEEEQDPGLDHPPARAEETRADPSWKTSTSSPRQLPAGRRFITIDVAGTTSGGRRRPGAGTRGPARRRSRSAGTGR